MLLPPITAWQKGMPDGYQFVLGFTAHHAFHPTLYKTPVYNPRTDFAPVALVVEQPFLLVTRTDFPVSNLQEFAAALSARRTRRVLVPARYAEAIKASAAQCAALIGPQHLALPFTSLPVRADQAGARHLERDPPKGPDQRS